MSVLQRQTQAKPDDSRPQRVCHTNKGLEATVGRYEPQPLAGHPIPADPCAAWVAEREAAREAEDSARIRWVYRYRRNGARTFTP